MTDLDILLHILSRFIHVICAIFLLGGCFYARQVLTPVLNVLPEDRRMQAAAGAQLRYRTILFGIIGFSLLSGIYNFLQTPHSRVYHIAFGIKMLWATSPYGDVTFAGKGKHRLVSITIAGVLVVLISAYLRSLSTPGF